MEEMETLHLDLLHIRRCLRRAYRSLLHDEIHWPRSGIYQYAHLPLPSRWYLCFIVFAIVATIWGGPTYVEFAIRSWRLIKKENFYRPLGANSRMTFDFVHWVSTAGIASVTAFLIIGSAPHIVFLRVLSLPGPALLLCLGGGILFVTAWSASGRPAPFRISSTAKGEPLYPGVFYMVEDVVAVNANAGRPYREALHARYRASPRFRKMMMNQSWFWGIPSVVIGIVLVVLICIHEVDKEVAYGIGEFSHNSQHYTHKY